ncbi:MULTISPECIES: alpha/beta hydrolase family protein [Fischerella]|uniref:Alpha/beta hydrolase n=1 Tax=Fischerella muscicola CCMEE 5323 TaxID=2019572 RepID=A0A2N6JXU6_FISMU|nr:MULTISPECIES: alpha/beta hydrolase [Fischerella]MBD2435109.1 alpha/beta hydrolase [Fischerella sp. FACHB-380]PLZ85379.1 alpha/beta hydrolase [Fischerella muscicola CCMEE 5323]
MTVRAFFQAAKVESTESPYDRIYLKILYPAQMSGSHTGKNMAIVPADRQKAPFPVVIFFNGVNCEAHTYQWLAVKLVERGLVVVTFNWIVENPPGLVSLTPGMDFNMWKPGIYGTVPTASALPTLLAKLEQLQAEGILAGMLDLERVILGGHSAGGRVAIENANPSFFPQVAASFAYAAHSMGGTIMGYEPGTILPLPDSLPMLLMGGTCDGVIANSSDRYGIASGDATTAVRRTFQEAIAGGRNDNYLVLLEGANHFTITDPFDFTIGSGFLDFPTTQSPEALRLLIADIIGFFIDAHVCHQPKAFNELNQLLNNSNTLIQLWKCK